MYTSKTVSSVVFVRQSLGMPLHHTLASQSAWHMAHSFLGRGHRLNPKGSSSNAVETAWDDCVGSLWQRVEDMGLYCGRVAITTVQHHNESIAGSGLPDP